MGHQTTRRCFLAAGTFSAVSASLGAAITAEAHPDAALIELSAEYDRAVIQRDAGVAAACRDDISHEDEDREISAALNLVSDVIERGMAIHAQTFEGLAVKARMMMEVNDYAEIIFPELAENIAKNIFKITVDQPRRI